MKKILVLATGGTISSDSSEEGLVPKNGVECIIDMTVGLNSLYEIETKDILEMDSSNIQPEEWQIIAKSVYENYTKYDGIVITHGTDTMAYTASILSYMLKNIYIPVVLTGSQLPIIHPLTDAFENLRLAFAMASSGYPGVFIAFHNKVILGTRAVKTRTMDFNAFESVNCPYAAIADAKGLIINSKVIPIQRGKPELLSNLSTDVFLVKLTPGTNPDIFKMLYSMNYKGIVIEAFGAGGMHFIHRNLVDSIKTAIEGGMSIAACSQCLYEPSDFSIYQTGKLALSNGIIPAFDMTTEATVTKLMWALGQSQNPDEIKKLFRTSLFGEIDISLFS